MLNKSVVHLKRDKSQAKCRSSIYCIEGIGIQILSLSSYMLVKATSSGLTSMDTEFKGLADQTFHTESASCQDKDFKVSG